MKNPQLITKENILKELKKENQSFTVVFIYRLDSIFDYEKLNKTKICPKI